MPYSSEQKTGVITLLIFSGAMLMWWWMTLGASVEYDIAAAREIREREVREIKFAVDINRATWVEFAALPGLGEKLSHAIVAHRQTHGDFSSIGSIRDVRGIGNKRLARVQRYLVCAP